jgi:two-component system response regulator NreC
MHMSEDFIIGAINAGAKGYLPKNTTKKELVNAIIKINKGEEFFSPNISEILLKSYINKAKNSDREKKKVALSEREIEILQLYAEGLTNQQIAERLFISVHTVAAHKTHIMQKLNIKKQLQLLKYAVKMKI